MSESAAAPAAEPAPTAAPTAEPAAAPSAAAVIGTPPEAAPEVETKAFHETFEGDLQDYVKTHGWQDPTAAVESYRNLEKYQGVPETQLLKIPKEGADPSEWGPVFDKLGRPEKSDGYELPDLDGESGISIMPAFKEAAHSLGLSQTQAKAIADWYKGTMDSATETLSQTAQHDKAIKAELEVQELQREWGVTWAEGQLQAQKAVAAFGISEELQDSLFDAWGPKAAMTFLRQVGVTMGEHKPPADAMTAGSFAMTPANAKAELEKLMSNPDWVKKWQSGDKAAAELKTKLNQAIAGG